MSESAYRVAQAAEPPGPPRAARSGGRPVRSYTFDRVSRLGSGSGRPVFAVIHSNGAFFPLGQKIGATHRFLALQAANRRSGGQLPGTVEEIAAGYVQQLLAEEPEGPFVIMGWCQAGAVAFEAAQQLQSSGHAVAGLVMVDTWNPAYTATKRPFQKWLITRNYGLQVVLQDLVQVAQGRLSLHDCVRQRKFATRLLGPMKSTSALTGPAAEAYLANKAFDEELGRMLAAACARYRPRAFSGPTLHVRSSTEPFGFGLGRRFGWGKLIDAQWVRLPGDHYTIFLEPAVEELGRRVMDMFGRG